MGHLDNAKQIGDIMEVESFTYCEDDNTWVPAAPIQRRAWACEVVLSTPFACPLVTTDLYTEMFGDA